jgi:hypothetical protein
MISRVSGRLFVGLLILLFSMFIYSQRTDASFAPLTEDDTVVWDCWNIGVTDPCQHGFRKVDFLHPNYGWAVGNSGSAWHWNGSLWQEANTPTDLSLIALAVVSETEVWAASGRLNNFTYDSTFFQWDGSDWQEFIIPPSENIGLVRDIAMTSTDFGLAVGSQGILQWNGATWTRISTSPANAVDLLSADEGWVVGPNMLLLHWDGDSLTSRDYPFLNPSPLNDVHILASDEVWIISESRDIGRWDGEEWFITPAPPTPGAPRVINMASSNDGWILTADTAVGNLWGQLWRWNGEVWSVANEHMPPSLLNLQMSGIYMLDESAGWLIGPRGLILYWDGDNWDTFDGQALPAWRPETTFTGLDALSSTAIWAVGYAINLGSTIIHWNGEQWNPQPIDNPIAGSNLIRDLAMVSETKGWAVGVSGIVLQWNGSAWQDLESPGSHGNLYAVDVVNDEQFWAVGQDVSYPGGGLVWQWDGEGWHSFESGVSATLRDISMLNANEGWAVGSSGAILHWDGADWNTVTHPITATLNAVFALSSDNVWVAGGIITPFIDQGVIAHWDGAEWQQVVLPENAKRLHDIHFLSPDNGLAVGDSVILRWDGVTWQEEISEAVSQSYAGILVGPDEGWILGQRFLARGQALLNPEFKLYLPLISR